MAKLPGNCMGTSTWRKDPVSGHWFLDPTGTIGQTATCVPATQFVDQGRKIDATPPKRIEPDDFKLFLRNYADDIQEVEIRLIPPGLPPIEINPERLTKDPSDTSTSTP